MGCIYEPNCFHGAGTMNGHYTVSTTKDSCVKHILYESAMCTAGHQKVLMNNDTIHCGRKNTS